LLDEAHTLARSNLAGALIKKNADAGGDASGRRKERKEASKSDPALDGSVLHPFVLLSLGIL